MSSDMEFVIFVYVWDTASCAYRHGGIISKRYSTKHPATPPVDKQSISPSARRVRCSFCRQVQSLSGSGAIAVQILLMETYFSWNRISFKGTGAASRYKLFRNRKIVKANNIICELRESGYKVGYIFILVAIKQKL